jgi:thiamine pyrophosphokinase
MMKTVYIITNGIFKDKNFYRKLLKSDEEKIIIGVDGGNNFLNSIGVQPNYAIGDFDSINSELLNEYKSNKNIKIIFKNNQDITDLEMAIEFGKNLKPSKVIILGALGDRVDHTINNIILLNRIKGDIEASIIEENQEINLVRNELNIFGAFGDIVSVIPISKVIGLTYEGLKWGVKNLDVNFGWTIGVSNEIISNKAKISLKKGIIIVIKNHKS